MKNDTRQWVTYAEENHAATALLLRSGHRHASLQNAQQTVEKFLKAILVEVSGTFPKTHSIRELRQLLPTDYADCPLSEDDCDLLDSVYLPSKYPLGASLPDFDPDAAVCAQCLEVARAVRIWARGRLGLGVRGQLTPAPKATAAAILLDGHTPPRVLLTLRTCDPFKGLWCLPGGHIEDNEKVLDAVVREVKEETGLDFTPQYLHFFDEIYPQYGVHHVVQVFFGTARGTLVTQPEEVAEARWFDLGEARRMTLAFGHEKVLDAYCARTGDTAVLR